MEAASWSVTAANYDLSEELNLTLFLFYFIVISLVWICWNVISVWNRKLTKSFLRWSRRSLRPSVWEELLLARLRFFRIKTWLQLKLVSVQQLFTNFSFLSSVLDTFNMVTVPVVWGFFFFYSQAENPAVLKTGDLHLSHRPQLKAVGVINKMCHVRKSNRC